MARALLPVQEAASQVEVLGPCPGHLQTRTLMAAWTYQNSISEYKVNNDLRSFLSLSLSLSLFFLTRENKMYQQSRQSQFNCLRSCDIIRKLVREPQGHCSTQLRQQVQRGVVLYLIHSTRLTGSSKRGK